MSYIELVPDGALPEVCAADRERFGYVPNFIRFFAHRPEAYGAWKQLNRAIKQTMDERRYELATLAAARRLRSSYCSPRLAATSTGASPDADDATQCRKARRTAAPAIRSRDGRR